MSSDLNEDLDFGNDFGRPLLSQAAPKSRRWSLKLPSFSLPAFLRRRKAPAEVTETADVLPESDLDQAPAKRRLPLGKLFTALGVVVLGGGLGVGIFILSTTSPGDMLAMLDVGDRPKQPLLSLSLPGRSLNGTQPASDSPGMLTPPVGGDGAKPPSDGGKPAADTGDKPASDTIKADAAKSAPAVPSATTPSPAAPSVAPPPVPAASAPVVPSSPPLAELPQQPTPRGADSAPTYASLPDSLVARKPLGTAPIDGLTQTVPAGTLPMIAADGRQPWKVHAMPFDAPANKPRLAVLVTGLGLDRDATEAAINKLPPEVTLVFSPYAVGLDKWMKKARDKGHEIMLTLPTEPVGYPANDPGPLGLLRTADQAGNSQQLDKSLARMINYVGVLLPDGPFTQSEQASVVSAACKQRGLLLVGPRAVTDAAVPSALVSTEIGLDLFRDAIDAELDRAASRAIQTGSAVVVVTPRPATFARLQAWFDKTQSLGMVLAPIASVVKSGR